MATESNTEKRLIALIQARIDRGDSTRTIATRAQKAGHKLSHSHVNNLHKGLVQKAPQEEEMIRALAAGLMVSEAEIIEAVWDDFFGYVPAMLQELLQKDAFLSQLPERVRRAVRMVGLYLAGLPDDEQREKTDELLRMVVDDGE